MPQCAWPDGGAGRADWSDGRPPASPDGDLSPRHPRGQPRPKATPGRSCPVGSAAPHHARHDARAGSGSSGPRRPAAPTGRPARSTSSCIVLVLGAHRRWPCGSSPRSGALPGCTSTARASTTAGPSPPTPPRSSTSGSRSTAPTSSTARSCRSTGSTCSRTSSPRPTAGPCGSARPSWWRTSWWSRPSPRASTGSSCRWVACSSATPRSRWSYVVDSIAPTLELPASLDARADRRARHDRGRGGGRRGAPARRPARRQRRRPVRGRLRLAAHRLARVRRRSTRPATARSKHVVVPGRLPGRRTRAVHVSAAAWADDELRAGDQGPHRPWPDRHRRARPQGRGRDRRLRLASCPRRARSARSPPTTTCRRPSRTSRARASA